MKESLQRQGDFDLQQGITALGADRGFASRASSAHLARLGIYDGVAPRDPAKMKERMSEEPFEWLQRRRGGLEGRHRHHEESLALRAHPGQGLYEIGIWRWPGRCSVTICGSLPNGWPWRSSGARSGPPEGSENAYLAVSPEYCLRKPARSVFAARMRRFFRTNRVSSRQPMEITSFQIVRGCPRPLTRTVPRCRSSGRLSSKPNPTPDTMCARRG